MIIRDATPFDIAAMAAVTAASYASGFGEILGRDALAARDAAYFAERFAETLPRMRIAESEKRRIVGLTLLTNGHLDMLFVDPALTGAGIGATLLADVEARGARTLECFRDNHAARRFYERHGWRLTQSYEREFIGCQRAFVAYEKVESASLGCAGS